MIMICLEQNSIKISKNNTIKSMVTFDGDGYPIQVMDDNGNIVTEYEYSR